MTAAVAASAAAEATMDDVRLRSFKLISGLAGKINVKCDLFADPSCDWEACNASSAS